MRINKMKSRVLLGALLLALLASLAACKKEEGAMEKVGKKMDESTHKMEDAVKDAAHDVEDAAKDAAKDVEDAIKEAKDGG